MDYIGTWKAISIVTTGGFGVIGLVKDYKDKATGRLTAWGRVSLIGIVVSSTLGLAAELKERSLQAQATTAATKQALALAKNTNQAVRDIQRALSPLNDPHVDMNLDANCSDPISKDFCTAILKVIAKNGGFKAPGYWPFRTNEERDQIRVDIMFFSNEMEEHAFNEVTHSDSRLFVGLLPTDPMVMDASKVRGAVLIAPVGLKPYAFHSDGSIVSIRDLPGTHMVIYDPQGVITRLHLNYVGIRFSNGQAIETKGPFEVISLSGHPAYRFVFPSLSQ